MGNPPNGSDDEHGDTPGPQQPDEATVAQLAAAKLKYANYLTMNPDSWLQIVELNRGNTVVVYDPWKDGSLALVVPEEDTAFAEALNNLYLPPRYTALYHIDQQKLEIVWTAYKLEQGQDQIQGREFDFQLNGLTHHCSFSRCSDRLLEIAKNSVPLMVSTTDFRNLRSFTTLMNQENTEGLEAFGEPLSFWVSDVEWDDDAILNLVRHLNFYLRYFDSESPVIQVHPVKPEVAINPKMRYFEGVGFPSVITGRSLDPSLLVLWNAAFGTSRPANFLNFYRIIEYVSFYHTHEEVRRSIRDIIKRPHVLGDLDRAARDILLVSREVKFQREQESIASLIREVVSPNLLWKEVSQNIGFFAAPTEFDGELMIEPLISETMTEEGFGKIHVERFASSITRIRNALAHGKDTKSAKTILPTAYNFDLLQPWVHLIAVAAGEVVLFDSTH